jgi:3-hydroxyisobutyrate dehydrogenase-like beta-hydroxyacid dehydrogenase
MTIATVGLLHPGAMGAAVGKVLTGAGRTVLWASDGRSAQSAARARQAGLQDAGTATALAARGDLVLSICPPHGAVDTARALGSFTGLYVDANAVSPATATEIRGVVEGAGARYVDGAIIGSPPAGSGDATRLYLSGADAAAVADLFAGSGLQTLVLDGEATAASALKMAYAGWTKATAALLLTMRAAARAHGVEDALVREWQHSIPSLPDRSAQAARAADEKGWRWVAEMREIAATLAAADLPTGFHEAAAQVFERRGVAG